MAMKEYSTDSRSLSLELNTGHLLGWGSYHSAEDAVSEFQEQLVDSNL